MKFVRMAFWIIFVLFVIGFMLYRSDVFFRFYQLRSIASTVPMPYKLNDKIIWDEDKELLVQRVRFNHTELSKFSLLITVTNKSNKTQYLGVEVNTKGTYNEDGNDSVFTAGATQDAEIFTLDAGMTYDLEREFTLTSSVRNEIRLKLCKCKNKKLHTQTSGGVFLPYDAEIIWEKEFILPMDEGVKQ
ncbi:MAG: hypothetical protein P9L94_12940 [Candidatus Hinthialibacter antarcticus]|nr:hypothetical protein [Candidatus Hinthialibacter antarcticus]